VEKKIYCKKAIGIRFVECVEYFIKLIQNKNIFTFQQASTCFKLKNNWFDLLNTQFPVDKHAKGYGKDLDVQNKIIDDMDELISKMRVHKHKTLLPFQKG